MMLQSPDNFQPADLEAKMNEYAENPIKQVFIKNSRWKNLCQRKYGPNYR